MFVSIPFFPYLRHRLLTKTKDGIYAGSALAIITCFRYYASGAVNLFARPMYDNLGVHWTMTLLGCMAICLAPAPFLFFRYGPAIRKKSRFAGMYARPANERKRTGRALSFSLTRSGEGGGRV